MRAPRPAAGLAVAIAVAVSLASCASGPGISGDGSSGATGGTGGSTAAARLTVFAAASLRDAFGAIQAGYPATHPGVGLIFSFDSSAALRAQIGQGAPADVFASADATNPQALVEAGLTAGPAAPFAGNTLAIVVPASNPAGVASWMDLAKPGLRVVAAGQDVPITGYADRLLANLAGLPGARADFASRVSANVVSREEDVRAVLAKIELGEGDAGIVYATDARSSTKVSTVPIPPPANVAATYDAVALKASGHPAEAADFVAWLAGPDAAAILEQFGFTPPSP